MKPGANGFLMYADFDKYNGCLDNADKSSLKRFFDRQTRKVWLPVRLAYSAMWYLFRSKMDLERLSKEREKNLCDAEGRTSWYHWGTENACQAISNAGFEVVDPDIEAINRDPITHFRKPPLQVKS
jgi:hypothetical protein